MKACIIGLLLIQALAVYGQPLELDGEIGESTILDETDATDPSAIEPTTLEADTPEPETTEPPTETTEIIETTPAPPICEFGVAFLPAPKCNEFYICLHGLGVLRTCPDTLYWDPILNVCNWDASRCDAEGTERVCGEGIEYLPVEHDCTRYIHCVHNAPWERHCPLSLFWNQPLQRCDYICDTNVDSY